MLDEAISYLKSLQLQVQVDSPFFLYFFLTDSLFFVHGNCFINSFPQKMYCTLCYLDEGF